MFDRVLKSPRFYLFRPAKMMKLSTRSITDYERLVEAMSKFILVVKCLSIINNSDTRRTSKDVVVVSLLLTWDRHLPTIMVFPSQQKYLQSTIKANRFEVRKTDTRKSPFLPIYWFY